MVGFHHRGDDGQTQPGTGPRAGRARRVAPPASLEEVRLIRVAQATARVADPDFDLIAHTCHVDLDGAPDR